ncbi:MAG: hypothetical protein HQL46_10890 [Gammaproteobacteria bacterium]|nr:hypothetical protein [Gammaproteobacteria bacterium]
MPDFIELITVSFYISAPILVIAAIGQWVIQFKLIPNHHLNTLPALRCIIFTIITAFILSIIIWLIWPFDPSLIMYNDRISIPASIAEFIAIPFWLKRCGYFNRETN